MCEAVCTCRATISLFSRLHALIVVHLHIIFVQEFLQITQLTDVLEGSLLLDSNESECTTNLKPIVSSLFRDDSSVYPET